MDNKRPNIVVVPDGIAADARGLVKNEVSFAYKAVLDFVAENYPDNQIYLAPANSFGADFTEQELAGFYLKEKGCKNYTITLPKESSYIDTFGNAALLKEFLIENSLWPLNKIILVSTNIHSYRARFCFESNGFKISKLEKIKYRIPPDSFIVKRLFYYKYKPIHFAYEIIAFARDFIRVKSANFITKNITEISKIIFYDKSLRYDLRCAEFVLAQIEKSPLHIKFGLKFLTLIFVILSAIYGIGRPFRYYQSNYQKVRFIEIFEKFSKTTRMFISFIRSMSLIYACDEWL